MSDREETAVTEDSTAEPPSPPEEGGRGFLLQLFRIGASLVVPVVAFVVLWAAFGFLRDAEANRIAVVVVALLVGVIGVFALYYGMDYVVSRLPDRYAEGVRPFVFVGPAIVVLSVFLLYPALNTVVLSFRDKNGTGFVGIQNYIDIFQDPKTIEGIRNSILWVIIVPLFAVVIGLAFAALADKLGRKAEATSKVFIFLPMAISFVGASIVWRFIYFFRPEGFGEQIGLLNGIMVGIGQDPVAWLLLEPWNNFFLMVIMVWLQVGFAMVILSAAIKAVPDDVIEAARIDGANEWQVFRRVVIPMISSSIVVVTTTIVITVWKVFDIVFVMTNGDFGTGVVAQLMVKEFFTFGNDGKGAALAVVLLVAVIPLMIVNVRKFQQQEETR